MLLFVLTHLNAGGCVGFSHDLVNIEAASFIQCFPNFCKNSFNLYLIAVASAEIVQIAIRDSSVLQCRLCVSSEFTALYKHQKAKLGHGRDQAPEIRVTGSQQERRRSVGIILPTGSRRKHNIRQRLGLNQSFDHDVLNWDLCKLIKNLPGCSCVHIVVKNDFANLVQQCFLIKVVQHRVELIGV